MTQKRAGEQHDWIKMNSQGIILSLQCSQLYCVRSLGAQSQDLPTRAQEQKHTTGQQRVKANRSMQDLALFPRMQFNLWGSPRLLFHKSRHYSNHCLTQPREVQKALAQLVAFKLAVGVGI